MATLDVNLEPQYRQTSSGMEVKKVMEGQRTTYGFTLGVLFLIALCICVAKCLTWLGTILEMGSKIGFRTWFGFAIHPVRHALLLWHCSGCFCLLCCVIYFFGGIKPLRGEYITPKRVVLTKRVLFYSPKMVAVSPQKGGFIPRKGWFYPPKKWA